MKTFTSLLATLSLAVSLSADPGSHLKAAEALVNAVAGPEVIKSGFTATISPMLANMRQQGAPEGMVSEFETAINEWFDQEIKWDDLRPQIAKLYAEVYTEGELGEILAFLKTPAGIKMTKSTPELMQKGMVIGQQYAMSKQAILQKRLQEISAHYEAAATQSAPAAEAAQAAGK
jgi:uncharacterized protein